jgi:hypothetical protein
VGEGEGRRNIQVGNEVKHAGEENFQPEEHLVERGVDAGEEPAERGDARGVSEEAVERVGHVLDTI